MPNSGEGGVKLRISSQIPQLNNQNKIDKNLDQRLNMTKSEVKTNPRVKQCL